MVRTIGKIGSFSDGPKVSASPLEVLCLKIAIVQYSIMCFATEIISC